MLSLSNFVPGNKVLVFDSRLYKDDVKTPLSITMQPATIQKVYRDSTELVADVVFERDNVLSKGHFLYAMEPL